MSKQSMARCPLLPQQQNLRDNRKNEETNLDELRSAFAYFDQNNDGSIEAEELKAVMESLGYQATESELQDMIHEADADGNGLIDFEEFVRMMTSKNHPNSNEFEEMKEAFNVFDRDGNGVISREELAFAMKNIGEDLTESDINDMIAEADTNGDGQIDFHEFFSMLSKK